MVLGGEKLVMKVIKNENIIQDIIQSATVGFNWILMR